MKHTPGPWIVEDDKRKGSRRPASMVMVVASAGGMPGILVSHGTVESRDYANARLIAAAPELLEALQDYIDQTTRYINDYSKELPNAEKARAAIAKATQD